MTVAKVLSVAPLGFNGHLIEVESDSSKGLPSLQIVGMGNKAIDEAKERVRSAVTNSLLEFPAKRITINLAPAELPKDGTHYDLAIALTILVNSSQLRQSEVADAVFVGELALDGSIRPIKGAIIMTETAKDAGITTIYVPEKNAKQACLIEGITVIGISSLKSLFLHLKGEVRQQPTTGVLTELIRTAPSITLDDIHGQEQAKRAMIIAAAGRHNILLSGSPGAGKTMLAKTLAGLLPDLLPTEQVAVTKLHSLAGGLTDSVAAIRPFRAPHHTSSRTALIGGGSHPKPGDISLAHNGVLFLDEMPEYPISSLEALRQPLEDRIITISRAKGHVTYPADFMLVGTMNPCPCGFYGDTAKECTCTSTQVLSYKKRLSGPLLDRIDLHVAMSRVSNDDLLSDKSKTNKQHLLAREAIDNAMKMQLNRYNSSLKNNSNLSSKDMQRYIVLSDAVKTLLGTAADRLGLSARGYFKVIKVARTIADLEDAATVDIPHVTEALQYRQNT